jgi:hypothetical protein
MVYAVDGTWLASNKLIRKKKSPFLRKKLYPLYGIFEV